ncbi:hypothetical protein D1007_58380 [Hordeum vulgare]|nr:hypothetical protein D1007_58380 [Hordeum vulgare]
MILVSSFIFIFFLHLLLTLYSSAELLCLIILCWLLLVCGICINGMSRGSPDPSTTCDYVMSRGSPDPSTICGGNKKLHLSLMLCVINKNLCFSSNLCRTMLMCDYALVELYCCALVGP